MLFTTKHRLILYRFCVSLMRKWLPPIVLPLKTRPPQACLKSALLPTLAQHHRERSPIKCNFILSNVNIIFWWKSHTSKQTNTNVCLCTRYSLNWSACTRTCVSCTPNMWWCFVHCFLCVDGGIHTHRYDSFSVRVNWYERIPNLSDRKQAVGCVRQCYCDAFAGL